MRRRLKAAGIPLIKKPRPYRQVRTDLSDDDIKRLYSEEGLTIRRVAGTLNAPKSTIKNRLVKLGIKIRAVKGSNCPWWKGGRTALKSGYILVRKPDHPRATNRQGYVLEHILVWEKTHHQPLPKGWIVHHINGIPSDNRPENLVAMPSKKHKHLIPLLQNKIRELEAENKQLHAKRSLA